MIEWIRPLFCLAILGFTMSTQVLLQRTFNSRDDWRSTLLQVLIMWGVFIWGTTEIVSLFHQLNEYSLIGIWTLAIASVMCLSFLRRQAMVKQVTQLISTLGRIRQFSLVDRVVGFGAASTVATLTLIALLAAPNSWDSMVYHLSRVMHWQQNQTVAFYPTYTLRQLHMNPWAEFAILHLQLLSGGDHLANFVEFTAMLGSIIGVSKLAKQLGGGLRAQGVAAVFLLTIPMGILQSTSTLNDYVIGFWLVCFVSFGLELLAQPTPRMTVLTGASLGLAILTKATAYLFAIPFVIWIGIVLLRKLRLSALKPALVIACLVLIINGGHYYRNYSLYGNPLGTDREYDDPQQKYTNNAFSPATLFSNIIRNAALHIGMPPPFTNINFWLQKAVLHLHYMFGLDPADPGTTWQGFTPRVQFSLDEDIAGNPLHFILGILAGTLILGHRWRRPDPLIAFTIAVICGALLFCLILRWQPWSSRQQLPLFLLTACIIGLASEVYLLKWQATGLAVLALIMATPFVFYHHTRPIIGDKSIFISDRVSQLFINKPALQQPYQQAIAFIATQGCRTIGWLGATGDGWEYPLWPLAQSMNISIIIEHVKVTNVSANIPNIYQPCLLMATGPGQTDEIQLDGILYHRTFKDDPVTIFMPDKPSIVR
jgi:4-amino-4-deoxy-L-arabinose transferase-like glycosyltransferase